MFQPAEDWSIPLRQWGDCYQNWNALVRQRASDRTSGFVGFDGQPIGEFAGNAGMLSVFVRGHNEMLDEGG